MRSWISYLGFVPSRIIMSSGRFSFRERYDLRSLRWKSSFSKMTFVFPRRFVNSSGGMSRMNTMSGFST